MAPSWIPRLTFKHTDRVAPVAARLVVGVQAELDHLHRGEVASQNLTENVGTLGRSGRLLDENARVETMVTLGSFPSSDTETQVWILLCECVRRAWNETALPFVK